ncbi:16573_t:CDS:2, partial [Racocetra persica]
LRQEKVSIMFVDDFVNMKVVYLSSKVSDSERGIGIGIDECSSSFLKYQILYH